MTVSKIRVGGTDHDIRAKYLVPSSEATPTEHTISSTTTSGVSQDMGEGIATISRIKGNTIKWNQFVQNGNFNGLTSWSTINSTASASNGVATVVRGSQSMGGFLYNTAFYPNTTHLYYIAATLSSQSTGVDMCYGFHTSSYTVGGNTILTCSASSKTRVSGIVTPKNTTDRIAARIGASTSAAGSTGTIENAICIDLTQIYGSGSEPTAAQFEAQYPASYYTYDAGSLYGTTAVGIKSINSDITKTSICPLNITSLTGKLNGAGSSMTIFPYGLKKVGNVYDEIVGNKAIKRVGSAKMKYLPWSSMSDNRFYAKLEGSSRSDNIAIVHNSRYTDTDTTRAYQNSPDNVIWTETASSVTDATTLRIRDTSAGGATATFVSALSDNDTIYYPLATPEEYIFDLPLELTYASFYGGTESILPVQSPTITSAPLDALISYSAGDVQALMGSQVSSISNDSLKNLLDAMVTAGVISAYTMVYNSDTGKYDFTITA